MSELEKIVAEFPHSHEITCGGGMKVAHGVGPWTSCEECFRQVELSIIKDEDIIPATRHSAPSIRPRRPRTVR